MTRLELATPTLARLCATNCATSAFCSRGLPRALVRHYPIPGRAQNQTRPARVHRRGRNGPRGSGKVVESRWGRWAIGAVGSALPSHGRGHQFESGIAHHREARNHAERGDSGPLLVACRTLCACIVCDVVDRLGDEVRQTYPILAPTRKVSAAADTPEGVHTVDILRGHAESAPPWGSRNATPLQRPNRHHRRMAIEQMEKPAAEIRRAEGQARGRESRWSDGSGHRSPEPEIRTRDIAAEAVGLTRGTYVNIKTAITLARRAGTTGASGAAGRVPLVAVTELPHMYGVQPTKASVRSSIARSNATVRPPHSSVTSSEQPAPSHASALC